VTYLKSVRGDSGQTQTACVQAWEPVAETLGNLVTGTVLLRVGKSDTVPIPMVPARQNLHVYRLATKWVVMYKVSSARSSVTADDVPDLNIGFVYIPLILSSPQVNMQVLPCRYHGYGTVSDLPTRNNTVPVTGYPRVSATGSTLAHRQLCLS